jgi:hypothetical protein
MRRHVRMLSGSSSTASDGSGAIDVQRDASRAEDHWASRQAAWRRHRAIPRTPRLARGEQESAG